MCFSCEDDGLPATFPFKFPSIECPPKDKRSGKTWTIYGSIKYKNLMYEPRTRRFTLRLLGDAGEKFEEIIKMKVSVYITDENEGVVFK